MDYYNSVEMMATTRAHLRISTCEIKVTVWSCFWDVVNPRTQADLCSCAHHKHVKEGPPPSHVCMLYSLLDAKM